MNVDANRLRYLLREFRQTHDPIHCFSCGDTSGPELAAIIDELLTLRHETKEVTPVSGFVTPPKPC